MREGARLRYFSDMTAGMPRPEPGSTISPHDEAMFKSWHGPASMTAAEFEADWSLKSDAASQPSSYDPYRYATPATIKAAKKRRRARKAARLAGLPDARKSYGADDDAPGTTAEYAAFLASIAAQPCSPYRDGARAILEGRTR